MLFPVCRPSASFLSSGDAHFLKHPLECGAGDPFRFLTTLAENMVQLFVGSLANLLLDGQQIGDCWSRIVKTNFCSRIGYRALELALNSVCVIQQHHAAIGIIV